MHWLDTSNVSSRVESSQVEFELYRSNKFAQFFATKRTNELQAGFVFVGLCSEVEIVRGRTSTFRSYAISLRDKMHHHWQHDDDDDGDDDVSVAL